MSGKVLVPLMGDDVAPRFDLATEVLIVDLDDQGRVVWEKTVVLPKASAEDLCHLILTEGVESVVCGGIEDQFYQYLTWKRVTVIDNVIGPSSAALDKLCQDRLTPGAILFERQAESS